MDALLCVGVEVQQRSHQVLDEAQGLAGHIASLQLRPTQQRRENAHSHVVPIVKQSRNEFKLGKGLGGKKQQKSPFKQMLPPSFLFYFQFDMPVHENMTMQALILTI